MELSGADILCYAVGTVVAIWYAMTKNWLANDILGVSFCIQAIEMMSLGTYTNGVILLVPSGTLRNSALTALSQAGLFVYDVFWVFGTGFFMEEGNSVMVSVAKVGAASPRR